jgi:hypothetical protein
MNYAEARTVGRWLRVLFGAILAIGFTVGNPEIVFGETGVLMVSLVGVIIFYVLYTIIMGRLVLTEVNPWIGALIMDWPLIVVWGVILGHLPLIPPSLILALLIYFGVSLVLSGFLRYGGCEVVTIPSLVMRKRYDVACFPFSLVDLLEDRIAKRISRGLGRGSFWLKTRLYVGS